jgi:ribosomal protein S8
MKNNARILKREGYIKDFITEGHGGKKTLQLYLKYDFARKP